MVCDCDGGHDCNPCSCWTYCCNCCTLKKCCFLIAITQILFSGGPFLGAGYGVFLSTQILFPGGEYSSNIWDGHARLQALHRTIDLNELNKGLKGGRDGDGNGTQNVSVPRGWWGSSNKTGGRDVGDINIQYFLDKEGLEKFETYLLNFKITLVFAGLFSIASGVLLITSLFVRVLTDFVSCLGCVLSAVLLLLHSLMKLVSANTFCAMTVFALGEIKKRLTKELAEQLFGAGVARVQKAQGESYLRHLQFREAYTTVNLANVKAAGDHIYIIIFSCLAPFIVLDIYLAVCLFSVRKEKW